jgi:hypothetical protein
MIGAVILAMSVVGLCRFALYYWRAILAGVAAQPVSESILEAARVENGCVTAGDFAMLAGLHDLTPDLNPGRGGLGFVRRYYRIVDAIGTVAGRRMPTLAAWTERELAICARYAAVQIDRRLKSNFALAASARSW